MILGVFQLLVVTPVSLSAGFASTASFLVITVADLLTVGIGVALIREPAGGGSPAPAQPVQA